MVGSIMEADGQFLRKLFLHSYDGNINGHIQISCLHP